MRRVGKLTLNRNPDNFFAETEQVAFHTGHVVPGIDFTNDPLLQGRLFSYIDTQLRRVGPNFAELPINRPLNPVCNNQRDAMARTVINKGRVSYFPNGLGGGCPMHSPEAADAFVSYAEKVDGAKIRIRSDSFSDHFSQATQFWNSMSDWEQARIAEAFAFELNQVESEEVRHHVINELLVNIADALAEAVSAQTGIEIAPIGNPENPTPSAPTPSGPLRPEAKDLSSPALSQDKPSDTIKGRKIAVLGGDGVDAKQLGAVNNALMAQEALVELIAAHAGMITDSAGNEFSGKRATSKERPRQASSTPRSAPAVAIPSDSVSSCRIMRIRPAPTAARTANSCCRSVPRASSKMETLPQPISSSDATAPSNRYKVGPSGRAYTSTMLRSLTLNLSGYCVGACLAHSSTSGWSSSAKRAWPIPGSKNSAGLWRSSACRSSRRS